MKNVLKAGILFTACAFIWACSEDADEEPQREVSEPRTEIPDPNFEAALVELGFDNEVDGSVRTASIDFVRDLLIDDKGIEDLTGIEDFAALVNLSVRDNNLTSINLSFNRDLLFLWAENNDISSLNLGTNPELEKVGLSGNRMRAFNTGPYPDLQLLTLIDNQVTELDVSGCPDLFDLAVEGNPLQCIQVSAQQIEPPRPRWTKDPEDVYSESCQ